MAVDVLQRFHPGVAKFVEAVLNNGGMGVCGELPKIIEPKSRYATANLVCSHSTRLAFEEAFSQKSSFKSVFVPPVLL